MTIPSRIVQPLHPRFVGFVQSVLVHRGALASLLALITQSCSHASVEGIGRKPVVVTTSFISVFCALLASAIRIGHSGVRHVPAPLLLLCADETVGLCPLFVLEEIRGPLRGSCIPGAPFPA